MAGEADIICLKGGGLTFILSELPHVFDIKIHLQMSIKRGEKRETTLELVLPQTTDIVSKHIHTRNHTAAKAVGFQEMLRPGIR